MRILTDEFFVQNLTLVKFQNWFMFEFDSKLLARKGRVPLYIFRLVRMGPFISIGANSQDLWTVFYLKGEMCDKGYSKKEDRPLVKPFDLRSKCNILVQLTALFPVCQSPPEIAMHALIKREAMFWWWFLPFLSRWENNGFEKEKSPFNFETFVFCDEVFLYC